MHTIGKVVLEAAVKAVVKEGASAAVRGATKSRANIPTADIQRDIKVIESNVDDIKSRLDRIAMKDLLASASFFNEGLLYLDRVFDKFRLSDFQTIYTAKAEVKTEGGKLKVAFPSTTAWKAVLCLAKALHELDESTKRALCDAKERFKDAHRKATKAFCNEALETSQRILAMKYRVIATILEKIEYPEEAIPLCKLCLEELHSDPVVQQSFMITKQNQTIQKEVRKLNSLVCDVTQMVSGGGALLAWPCIMTGGGKIDPVHERTLREHCCQTWSFGQSANDDHRLKFAWSISSNSRGEFIVGDSVDRNIKVFDDHGMFLYCLRPFTYEEQSEYEREIWNIACDQQDNIYVLTLNRNQDGRADVSVVYVFNKQAHLIQKFTLRKGFRGYALTVDDFNRIFVSGGSFSVCFNDTVEVYEGDGMFVQSFGKETLNNAQDITATYDGHSLVLDTDKDSTCLRVFSAQGHQLTRFSVAGSMPDTGAAVDFHRPSETVLVAAMQSENHLEVSMYSKDFKFLRVIQFRPQGDSSFITGVTATVKGSIAVPCKSTVLYA